MMQHLQNTLKSSAACEAKRKSGSFFAEERIFRDNEFGLKHPLPRIHSQGGREMASAGPILIDQVIIRGLPKKENYTHWPTR
jgi:hypothetical protein